MKWWNEYIVPKIPRFIRNNFTRKLLAFIVTSCIAVLVYKGEKTNDSYIIENVPVHLILAKDLCYKTQDPPEFTVNVTVTGRDIYLREISKEYIEIRQEVDAENARSGQIKIDLDNVKITKRFLLGTPKVKSISPTVLSLDLDRQITKENVPVFPVYQVEKIKKGYILGGVKCRPERISISGPSRFVNEIREVRTEEIPLDVAVRGFTTTVNLICPNGDITLSRDQISCDIRITAQRKEEINNIPVQIILSPSGDQSLCYTVAPKNVTVECVLPSQASSADISKFLRPYVLVDGLDVGITPCKVRCVTDLDDKKVKIISIKPPVVAVTVEKILPDAKTKNKATK